MAGIRRFEEIQAWQKARELTREIYKLCEDERLSRDYGIRNQICRAAVLTMSKIAEGFGRGNPADFTRFLDMARGSAIEVQALLYAALDVGYIEQSDFDRVYKLSGETIALIAGFTTYLRKHGGATFGARNPEPAN